MIVGVLSLSQDSDEEQEEEGARAGFEKQKGNWSKKKGESKRRRNKGDIICTYI